MLLALTEYLKADTTLTALIPASSMTIMAMKKGIDRPYLIISRVSRSDTQDLGQKTTFSEADMFEIDVVTSSGGAGETFREALRVSLSAFRGDMGTTSPVYVNSCSFDNGFDFTETFSDGTDDFAYHTPSMYTFAYTQVTNSNEPVHPNGDWTARYEFNQGGLTTDITGGSALVNTGSFVTSFNDSIRGYVAQWPSSGQPQLNGAYTGNSTGDASWAVWINGDSFGNIAGNSSDTTVLVSMAATVFQINVAGDLTTWFLNSTLSTNTWYYITFTRISNVFRVYVNAVEQTNIVGGTGTSTNAIPLDRIGANAVSLHWQGEMDNFTDWDYGSTQSQITANYDFEK